VTLPGFRHDLYATNLSAFQGSSFVRRFGPDLRRHGLEFVRAPKAFCSVFPDGDLVGVTTSVEETLADLRRLSVRDAEAWRSLIVRFQRTDVALLNVLRHPMPSLASFGMPFFGLRLAFQSSGSFVNSWFEDPKVQALWAVWGLHLDFPPEIRGGALYPFLQCMQIQQNGLALGKGGAAIMITAMTRLLAELGSELHLSSPVSEIVIDRGKAVGAVCGGETLLAREAVIANVTPTVLFRLVKRGLPPRRYRYGPGTMMIHLALSDLPDWRAPRARDFAYIHVAPSLAAMSSAYDNARRGVPPDDPVLIVAQPTVVDPSRAPPGRHVLSIQVRVLPPSVDGERYGDHILDILERYAPGLRRKILARHVILPEDMERSNPNLVGGDSLGGSHHLGQHFIFRPFLGWSRYQTPIERLFVCGASTWPGAGVGAGSGWLLGQMLTQR
ncbi:MAG: phytoene desaturase family protein, partial [Stellaceae bacterium]